MYGFDSTAAYRSHRIETAFHNASSIDAAIIEHYKNELSKLSFMEGTDRGFRWQLTEATTKSEMAQLIAIISDVADKVATS